MKKAILISLLIMVNFTTNAQKLYNHEITFQFNNLFNQESLKLEVSLNDDGSVMG